MPAKPSGPGLDFTQTEAQVMWKALQRRIGEMERLAEHAEEAKKHFRKFVELTWPAVEPARKFVASWAIDAVADHLQACADGQILRLLIAVPPGSGKSILTAVDFPAWVWIGNPQWRSIFASYDGTLATRDSVRCRDLMESGLYQSTFKPTWTFATSQNEKQYFANTEKGFRISTSVTGKGTGFRAMAVIVDDALNARDRFSEPALSAVYDWWQAVIFNRLLDMEKGVKIVVGQRLSDRDLHGHILRAGGYEYLKIPMEFDPRRTVVTSLWKDPRTVEGELMSPAIFPPTVVADLKKHGESWESQYQQEPVVEGGGILKSHCWNYWRPRRLDLPPVKVRMPDGSIEERPAVPLPDSFSLTLTSWDAAFKDLEKSDYVVGFVVSVSGADRFVRDQVRAKMDCPATIKAIRNMAARYPEANLHLIENKANGPAAEQSLRHEVSGILLVEPQGGKISRVQGAAYEVESRNWYLPHPMLQDWVGDPENPLKGGFLRESSVFPFGGKEHDDACDAWSQAAIRIQAEKLGGFFGVSDSDLMVSSFPVEPKWPQLWALSVNWKDVGVVWMARRPETGEHFIYAAYAASAGNPAAHAKAILTQGAWIPGAMQAHLQDEYAMVRTYRQNALKIDTFQGHEESDILDLKSAFLDKKIKVFANLEAFFTQFRMFRRSDRGRLPDEGCALIEAAAIAWRAKSRLRPMPDTKPKQERRPMLSPQDWMSR